METAKLFFVIRGECVVNLPTDIKDKKEIQDFMLAKLVEGDIDNWVEGWIDEEVEEFNLDLDEENF